MTPGTEEYDFTTQDDAETFMLAMGDWVVDNFPMPDGWRVVIDYWPQKWYRDLLSQFEAAIVDLGNLKLHWTSRRQRAAAFEKKLDEFGKHL